MANPIAEATVEIDAPIEVVWNAMIDVNAYCEWNPFIFKVEGVTGLPSVGQKMLLHVRWANGKVTPSNEVFSAIEPPSSGASAASSTGKSGGGLRKARLEYSFRGPLHTLYLVRGSRVQTLEQSPGGPTTYRTSEQFFGLLTGFIPLKDVQDGFDRHARALKDRAEQPERRTV